MLEGNFSNKIYVGAVLHVPEESIEKYRTAPGWSDFFTIEPVGVEAIESDSEVFIYPDGNNIVISGADENVYAEVYSTDGCKVYSGKDCRIGGLGKGVYIVRAAGKVRKIIL